MNFFQVFETDGYEEQWPINNLVYKTKKDAYRAMLRCKYDAWASLRENADSFLRREKDLYDWHVHHQQDRIFYLKQLELA